MLSKYALARLRHVGCYDVVREVRLSPNRTLTPSRWRHHITIAIRKGFVSHVEALLHASGTSLTTWQADCLTVRCLELEWNVDAIGAAHLGAISKRTRRRLVKALVASRLVDSRMEALEVLRKPSAPPSE